VKQFFQSLFLTGRTFAALGANIALFVLANFLPVLFVPAIGVLGIIMVALAMDIAVLYRVRKGIHGLRNVPEKLSNGDENTIRMELENYYNFPIQVEIIDEVPFQFNTATFPLSLTCPQGRLAASSTNSGPSSGVSTPLGP
jgi:uncharacterized protein (DUF58 family)